jgi:hypothetical protein
MARNTRSIAIEHTERQERQDYGHVSSDCLRLTCGTVSRLNRLRNGRYSLASSNTNLNSIYDLIWESPTHSAQLVVGIASHTNFGGVRCRALRAWQNDRIFCK